MTQFQRVVHHPYWRLTALLENLLNGYHLFLNLHGQEPLGMHRYHEAGEIPRFSPWFLPEDIPSFVVIHALPICRTINNQFAPTYTAFILTYFTQDPQLMLRKHIEAGNEFGKDDIENDYHPIMFSHAGPPDESVRYYHNYAERAAKGQYGWLDFTQPDLPLRIGKGLILPEIYLHPQGNPAPHGVHSSEPLPRMER
jgi:hypothetical protein